MTLYQSQSTPQLRRSPLINRPQKPFLVHQKPPSFIPPLAFPSPRQDPQEAGSREPSHEPNELDRIVVEQAQVQTNDLLIDRYGVSSVSLE